MQGNYYNPTYGNLEQYVVKQNDSLYMIAKKYHISVDELKNANHLVSNMIYPNQILFIPKTQTAPSSVTTNGIQGFINKVQGTYNYAGSKTNQHVVRTNDTIEDILAMHHLSPLEFLKLNETIFLNPVQTLTVGK